MTQKYVGANEYMGTVEKIHVYVRNTKKGVCEVSHVACVVQRILSGSLTHLYV